MALSSIDVYLQKKTLSNDIDNAIIMKLHELRQYWFLIMN
jgi:hypothetical protein